MSIYLAGVATPFALAFLAFAVTLIVGRSNTSKIWCGHCPGWSVHPNQHLAFGWFWDAVPWWFHKRSAGHRAAEAREAGR